MCSFFCVALFFDALQVSFGCRTSVAECWPLFKECRALLIECRVLFDALQGAFEEPCNVGLVDYRTRVIEM